MARFHFNVFDSVNRPDRTGTEFPDWQLAQREAIRRAGEMLIDCSRREEITQDWSMNVTDGDGLILFRLDFIISGSAALTIMKR